MTYYISYIHRYKENIETILFTVDYRPFTEHPGKREDEEEVEEPGSAAAGFFLKDLGFRV